MEPALTQHVEIRENRRGEDRAFIAGTRVRVQDIVSDCERHGMSPDEIAREFPHISLAQVHAALAYYFDHRDEIRAQMKADAEFASSMQAQNSPSPLEKEAPGTDADTDAVSS